MRALILAVTVMFTATGCGTCMNYHTAPSPYGGVCVDVGFISNLNPRRMNEIKEGDSQGWAMLFGVTSIIDLPFSVVADTVMLPITIPAVIHKNRTGDYGHLPGSALSAKSQPLSHPPDVEVGAHSQR
jgi:uncharacterized protein YceK